MFSPCQNHRMSCTPSKRFRQFRLEHVSSSSRIRSKWHTRLTYRFFLKKCCFFTLIDSDWFAAGIAILGKDSVETVKAIRPWITHDVTLTAQNSVAFKAGKMTHMPGPAFRFRALVRQDELNRPSSSREKISIRRQNPIMGSFVRTVPHRKQRNEVSKFPRDVVHKRDDRRDKSRSNRRAIRGKRCMRNSPDANNGLVRPWKPWRPYHRRPSILCTAPFQS